MLILNIFKQISRTPRGPRTPIWEPPIYRIYACAPGAIQNIEMLYFGQLDRRNGKFFKVETSVF